MSSSSASTSSSASSAAATTASVSSMGASSVNKNSSTKNEYSSAPDPSSGFSRMAPIIVGGWTLLTTVFLGLKRVFRDSPTILFLQAPHPEFCEQQKQAAAAVGAEEFICSRSDLFAFQVCSTIAFVPCAFIGLWTWHVSRRSHTALPSTPAGRIFGYLPEAEILCAINFTYQSWDLVASLFIPEHCSAIMLAHHFMAGLATWCAVQYQIMPYYAFFFLGLTEVSSLFLIHLDLTRFFPAPLNSYYEAFLMHACGPCFAVTFFLYRVLWWWPESLRLFSDVSIIWKEQLQDKLRPKAPKWILVVFLATNLPLGFLQLYWLTLIAQEAQKLFSS